MQNVLTISATATPVSTEPVAGAGNYAAYFDFSAMQAGDAIAFEQLVDIVGTVSPKVVNSAEFTAEDLALASEQGALAVPVTLEAGQVLGFSLSLSAGTAPLEVPYRITNIQTGA